MLIIIKTKGIDKSPLAQGRGLKQIPNEGFKNRARSPLAQGRGLKLLQCRVCIFFRLSPLAQGRGLKHQEGKKYYKTAISRPSRRGVD